MDITGKYVEVALSDSAASECLGMEGTASGLIIAGVALGEGGGGVWLAIKSYGQTYSHEQSWPAPETYLIPWRYISAIRCLPDRPTERTPMGLRRVHRRTDG